MAPNINTQLSKNLKAGSGLEPLQCGELSFQCVDVNGRYVVDLERKKCEHGYYAVSWIPCSHVMLCITKKMMNPHNFVHPCRCA